MVLKIGDIIKLLVLIVVAFLFPIEVNAHKGEHNFKEEKQDEVKPSDNLYQLSVINPAPDFTLVDINGKKISLKNLKGKIKIINFIYASCPDVCPIVTGRLSRLQAVLKREGLLGKKVKIISISIDPERDTTEKLKKYADGFKAESNNWLFLRGTKEETNRVLSDYDIWLKKQDDGTIDHVMRIYLIDDKDRIREIYNLGFLQPELVVRDIEMILFRPNPQQTAKGEGT